jgi:ethanolamine kinase
MPPNTSNRPPHEDNSISIDASLDRLIEATPYYDIEVSSTALFEGAFKVVSLIFPNWKYDDIKFVQCKDGITNQCKYLYCSHFDLSLTVL